METKLEISYSASCLVQNQRGTRGQCEGRSTHKFATAEIKILGRFLS